MCRIGDKMALLESDFSGEVATNNTEMGLLYAQLLLDVRRMLVRHFSLCRNCPSMAEEEMKREQMNRKLVGVSQ